MSLVPSAIVLLSLAVPVADGDPLAAAQKAYGEVDYGRCRDEAVRALNAPADMPSRADAWRYLGLCHAALGDTDKARDAFKHMLAIDHDARLPDGLSPRFTSTYREAKGSFVTGPGLALTIDDETIDGGTRNLRLKLVDELEMVAKIGWRGAEGTVGPPVKAAPLLEIAIPAEADVTVTALDASGGEVAILLLPKKGGDDAPPPPPPPDKVADEGGGFPWLAVGGVTLSVVALAAAGAGAYVLLAPPQQVTLRTDVAFGK